MTKIVFFTGIVSLPTECRHGLIHIPEKASVGLARLVEMLTEYEKSRLSERL